MIIGSAFFSHARYCLRNADALVHPLRRLHCFVAGVERVAGEPAPRDRSPARSAASVDHRFNAVGALVDAVAHRNAPALQCSRAAGAGKFAASMRRSERLHVVAAAQAVYARHRGDLRFAACGRLLIFPVTPKR